MPRTFLRLGLAPTLALLALLLLLSGLGLAGELLENPGLNNPDTYADTGRDWREWDEKVAGGWWYFYVADGTYEAGDAAPKLHWMSSRQFSQALGGLDYFREGDASQVIWSSYDFDAGIYQQVGGLTIGQDYAFEAALASFWRGSGYPITDGKIKKCIGIDPYGGTDPTASAVIWDWDNCDTTDKTWPYLDIAATAQATTMTLFVRIQSPENNSFNHTDLNYVFIDDGRMALAPTVVLSVPVVSDDSIDLEWSATPDQPDWSLQGVEVQYKDHADGIWHTIQEKTDPDAGSEVLDGKPGHTYTIRARPWQAKGGYDLHGLWVEKQVQVGGAFVGYVRNNFGAGVGGASISAAGSNTTSEGGGFYGLKPPSYGQPYTLVVSASGYLSPVPIISQTVVSETSITPITFTLKPANDVITNGDFEIDTTGWLTAGTGSAAIFSGGHRSGYASLALSGPVTLTQNVVISGAYNPTLSFWRKGGDSFQVSLAGSTGLVSTTVAAAPPGQWQHGWLPLGQSDLYTGTLSVGFHLAGSTSQVFLDEISLGDGPHTLFLPIIIHSATP